MTAASTLYPDGEALIAAAKERDLEATGWRASQSFKIAIILAATWSEFKPVPLPAPHFYLEPQFTFCGLPVYIDNAVPYGEARLMLAANGFFDRLAYEIPESLR